MKPGLAKSVAVEEAAVAATAAVEAAAVAVAIAAVVAVIATIDVSDRTPVRQSLACFA